MVMGIGGDLLPVLEQIEKNKGIKKEDLLEMIESALVSSFKKHTGKNKDIKAKIDPETGNIEAFVIKNVVDKVEDDDKEISLIEAKKINNKVKLNQEINISIDVSSFGRIAAQTAKQVIIQRIRKTEKENLFNQFKSKEGEIVNGQVQRFVNESVIVDLGKAEGVLPVREKIPTENYRTGEYLKFLVLKVESSVRGPRIILSRTHPEVLRKLLELEIPEISDSVITVKGVVRDPGNRAKVSVYSNNAKVDPIGACVGVKGSRIKVIIDELSGERIDLVSYDENIINYVRYALNPAKLGSITIDEKNHNIEVLVPDDQLSLAIGKGGQNVRLAAKLLGWRIDILSESKTKLALEEKRDILKKQLSDLKGVGPKISDILIKAGYKDIARLKEATKEELLALQGIGEKMAEKIIKSLENYVIPKNKEKNENKDNSDESK